MNLKVTKESALSIFEAVNICGFPSSKKKWKPYAVIPRVI